MNTFGRMFRIHLFGESHGAAVGLCIDGCPPGIPLSEGDLNPWLERRRPGARGTTARRESDRPQILSGCYREHSTGSPITILFANKDTRPEDYKAMKDIPRPGHADWVAQKRYKGFNDPRGGGHFSGRLTLPLVAAGAIASRVIHPVSIHARLLQAGGSPDIEQTVESAMDAGDSVGGLVECRARHIPPGWGEPFFDAVESMIAHLAFAVPAIKGIEFGSGFASAAMRGSEHNDPILDEKGTTATNFSGGISGGLTNGNELLFRVAVKPTSSIGRRQRSYSRASQKMEDFSTAGRHDACIALRVPVVMEAITAIALADFKLLHAAWQ